MICGRPDLEIDPFSGGRDDMFSWIGNQEGIAEVGRLGQSRPVEPEEGKDDLLFADHPAAHPGRN